MVKNVLHSVFAAMAIAFAMNVSAQVGDAEGGGEASVSTVGYFATMSAPSSYLDGTAGRVFSVDLADPETVLGECCLIPTETNSVTGDTEYYTIAGATVGDAYYAYVEGVSADYPVYYFYSFNMEGDETSRIAEVGDDVAVVMDMACDPVSGTLYAVSQDGGNTNVYTVDVTNGEQTLYCTLEGVCVSGLTFDGEGNAYAVCDVTNDGGFLNVSIDLSLYSVSLAGEESTATKIVDLKSLTGQTSALQSHTLAFNGEKLYFAYTSGRIISCLPDGTGIEELRLGVRSRVAGLTFTESTVTKGATQGGDEEEEDNGLRLTCVETYGDVMGQFADDVMSKRNVTFYDEYNNPVREVQYGRKAEPQPGENPWLMMYYTKYEYNADHRLVSRHSELVQEYVRGEYYYKSNNDTVKYEYDENGRLAKETTVASGQTISYEYDESGQLVKKVTATPDRFGGFGAPDKITTETYSGFVAFNQPSLIEIESPYSTTWEVVEFDADNHKVKTTTYSDEERTEATTVEHWTWRNDSIVEYATNRVYDGVEEPYKRTVYECEDGNPMRVREASYYLSRDKWYRDGLPKVSCYSYLNAQFAPTNIAVEPVDDAVNTGKVTFTAPAFPVSEGTVSYDIYRMGVRVATITNDGEAFDPETGIFTYVDSIVPNGEYDYMVQTVVKDDATGDSTAYNVSEVVPMTYHVDLPAATNVRGEVVTVEDGANIVTIAWDAPENLDPNLLFEYYNIYVAGVGQANADDAGQIPITDTQYGVTFARSTQDIYVESVYHFGRVVSDTVTVDMRTLPNVGIDDAVQSVDGGKVSVSANEITVDGVASSVLVFSVGGAVEVSCRNVSRADISGLQPGVYVALVNIDGKNIAVKFTK